MNTNYYMQLNNAWLKIRYFLTNGFAYILPHLFLKWRDARLVSTLTDEQRQTVERRSAYYCQHGLSPATDKPMPAPGVDRSETLLVRDFHFPMHRKHRFSTYFFDLLAIVRLFPGHFRFRYYFGDMREVPAEPTFVKSRPITKGNCNSVLLNLNKVRHFHFIKDQRQYETKKDMLVFRNACSQPHRILFLEKFFGHPMVDACSISAVPGHPEWQGQYMTIDEQLSYKFIACIEGNDVATNLKWVMASNSIAVMPRPKFETWFMEGTLRPDYHYIEVKDDYSNLEERLQYYIQHPEKAAAIISHAHEYIQQFRCSKIEKATAIATARRYFQQTGQEKTLLVRLSALGDVAMTLPAVYSAAMAHPHEHFYFLTTPRFQELLVDAPANLHFIPYEKELYGGAKGICRMVRLLREQKISRVVDLHNVSRSWVIDLVAGLAGLPVTMLNKQRSARQHLLGEKGRKRQVIPYTERYFETLQRAGVPTTCLFKGFSAQTLSAHMPEGIGPKGEGERWIGIAPFARYETKVYPLEKMYEIIMSCIQEPDVHVFLFGGGKREKDILDTWAAASHQITSMAGKTTMTGELALMSVLDRMLSMDSANQHLASLTGCRVLTIWGGTAPQCGFAPWQQQEADALMADLDCQPCSIAGTEYCPQKKAMLCMKRLEVPFITQKLLTS